MKWFNLLKFSISDGEDNEEFDDDEEEDESMDAVSLLVVTVFQLSNLCLFSSF